MGLKAKEKAIEEFKKKQKDGAQNVLGRMTSASESGLVAHMFQLWVELVKEQKEGAEMEAKLNQKAQQMGRFKDKNKKSAGTAAERAAQLLDVGVLSFTFCI